MLFIKIKLQLCLFIVFQVHLGGEMLCQGKGGGLETTRMGVPGLKPWQGRESQKNVILDADLSLLLAWLVQVQICVT